MSMRKVIEWFCPHTTKVTVSLALLRMIQRQGETIMGDIQTLQAAVQTLANDAAAVKLAVETGKTAVETKLTELTATVADLQTKLATGTVPPEAFDAVTASVVAVGETIKSIGVPAV